MTCDIIYIYIVHWKGVSKDTFLLPLLTFVLPSLTISFFSLGLLVWLCRFRRECCFIQNNIHFFQGHPPKSKTQAFVQLPWQLDTKDLHRLVFCIQTTRKSSQVEKKLAMKFELTHINRKLVQATTSHRKLAVKRGASMNKLKTYDDLRYLWSGL